MMGMDVIGVDVTEMDSASERWSGRCGKRLGVRM